MNSKIITSFIYTLSGLALFLLNSQKLKAAGVKSEKPNVIFILIDDQRYDFLSFLDHPWIETPNIDKLAEKGMYFKNAFVTTSLCSPSRASILTGMYAHAHNVIDNDTRLSPDLPTFPGELQKNGYRTALIGKWHMGGASADPRPGFDHWISFRSQGPYFDPNLNINGEVVPRKGYTPDILTEYAVEFIKENIRNNEPYCLYFSHKSVHEDFSMAPRHKDYYDGLNVPRPSTFENNEENTKGKPDWVVKQRKSQHGAERKSLVDFDYFFQRYSECMLGVDESVGEIIKVLEDMEELENTIIIYFSDNGYLMGEHGLIDKRVMYEESIRVPMFIYYPELIKKPAVKEEFALSIDIGPTILELTNTPVPEKMQGRSLLPIILNEEVSWREDFLYEYFNDPNAVQTPTIFGLRTKKYSYITTHGVWDNYELYELDNDPEQKNNLLQDIEFGHNYGTFINQVMRQSPELLEIVLPLEKRLNEIMQQTCGKRTPSFKMEDCK
jgi:N-acetylglucosamine-6-sulfatase